jgi:predicted nuclease of predicted toxin-antitoxin system
MAEGIRFHLDEHMDPDIAAALRRVNIDVTTAADQNFLGRSDEEHLQFALSAGRVIVTDDADFLALATTNPNHAGIVFCRRTKHTLGAIIRFLILVHDVCEPGEMIGRVEYL